MIRDIGLPDLYRGKANLWIEDGISRVYLRECWVNDPDIFYLTAGGNDHVQAILKDAIERNQTNVVGFIDRDFRVSNRLDWLNPAKGFRCFVPTVHEVENFLLDARVLAGSVTNTARLTVAEIEQHLEGRARELAWWMTCRMAITRIRHDFTDDFLLHPTCPAVTDLASAEQFIIQQPWFQQLRLRTDTLMAVAEMQRRLNAAHAIVQQQLTDGSWRREFSGKELFRHIRGRLYHQPPKPTSPSDIDIDVARAIAQWQVVNNQVPAEITELRLAIRHKVGL